MTHNELEQELKIVKAQLTEAEATIKPWKGYDALTTVTGTLGTLATSTALIVPAVGIYAIPVAIISNIIFAWATNKGRYLNK